MVFMRNTFTISFLRFRRRGAPLFALALAALCIALSVTPAHAASVVLAAGTPPSGFSVSGAITEIASPAAYQGPNVRFFDLSHELLRIPQPHYYVVSGSLKGGNYLYLYELNASRGSAAASIEVAINSVAHTQLIEVGVPTPASVALATHSATATSAVQSTSQRHGQPVEQLITCLWYSPTPALPLAITRPPGMTHRALS
ncbi:hypothetical protein KTAU_30580 [Thermogemmatispora aurantia]|nr:hypothetical protein KTAU_30580 [Thermogemmatispora aurantia]